MRGSGKHVFRHDIEFLQFIVSRPQFPNSWFAADPLTLASTKVCKLMNKQFAKGNFYAVWRRRSRGVAQSGSAPVLGTGGREFESLRPDQHQQEIRIARADPESAQRFPACNGWVLVPHRACGRATSMTLVGCMERHVRIPGRLRGQWFVTVDRCPCRVFRSGSWVARELRDDSVLVAEQWHEILTIVPLKMKQSDRSGWPSHRSGTSREPLAWQCKRLISIDGFLNSGVSCGP